MQARILGLWLGALGLTLAAACGDDADTGSAGSTGAGAVGGSLPPGGGGAGAVGGGEGGVAGAGAASGLGRAGRWLSYDAEPAYFVGFDCQELACDPTLDYAAALDAFVQYRINKVRIWVYCWFGTTSFGASTPWQRDGNGRHDLDQWDEAYWSRVKAFITAAEERAIVVEISIFSDYPADAEGWASSSYRLAWNTDHNQNGAFSANGSGHVYPEYFDADYAETTSTGNDWRHYQRALIDKTLAELDSFANVYFEIHNEFPAVWANGAAIDQVHGWQTDWIGHVDVASARLVAAHAHEGSGQHLRGVEYFWDDPALDVLNFHFYSEDPQTISDLLHGAQQKGKVLSTNESGDYYGANLDGQTRYAWGMFMAGGYFALYEDDSSRIGSAGWVAGAERLRALRDVAESVRFWELSPVDGEGNELDALIAQGPSGSNRQLIAHVGAEYVAYFWGGQSTDDVEIELPAGSYSYRWVDVRDGSEPATGSVPGGGTTTIASPPVSEWSGDAGIALVLTAGS